MQLPFLRSKSPGPGAQAQAVAVDDEAALQAAAVQARRRLIGALVLLGAAVVGFPLLFETQPRPTSGALPIEAGRVVVQAAPSTTAPAGAVTQPAPLSPAGKGGMVTAQESSTAAAKGGAPQGDATPPPPSEPVAQRGPEQRGPEQRAEKVNAPAPTTAEPAPSAAPTAVKAVAAPAAVAAVTAAAAATGAKSAAATAPPKAAAPVGASTSLITKPSTPPVLVDAPPPAAESGAERHVVQVGAYNDMQRMRQARDKAEKLGFKTYTTEVDTPTGRRTRVRLGPFSTRSQAEAAAAKVKAAGMDANVLTL
jgi:DedD protein